MSGDETKPKQLLHLVFGGELSDLDGLDIVGVYPNYATAYAAWRAKAQQTVDNAQMRYFIVHLHRLLDPEAAPEDMRSTTASMSPRASRPTKNRQIPLAPPATAAGSAAMRGAFASVSRSASRLTPALA